MTTRSSTRVVKRPFKGTVLIVFEEPERSEIELAATRDRRSPTEIVRQVMAKWARKQVRERERVAAERRQAG